MKSLTLLTRCLPDWASHAFFDAKSLLKLERAKGFEPSTPTLARSCSTPELHPHPLDIWPNRDTGRQGRSYSQKAALNATTAFFFGFSGQLLRAWCRFRARGFAFGAPTPASTLGRQASNKA
jgi:hypothetical protein